MIRLHETNVTTNRPLVPRVTKVEDSSVVEKCKGPWLNVGNWAVPKRSPPIKMLEGNRIQTKRV